MGGIGENILKSINILIDNKTKNLGYDKTFEGVVWGKNSNGTYKISYMNETYNVSCSLGIDLELGERVLVKIPSGVFRRMHICGINSNKIRTSSGTVVENYDDTEIRNLINQNAAAISAVDVKVDANTSDITALEELVGEGYVAITKEQIDSLFIE